MLASFPSLSPPFFFKDKARIVIKYSIVISHYIKLPILSLHFSFRSTNLSLGKKALPKKEVIYNYQQSYSALPFLLSLSLYTGDNQHPAPCGAMPHHRLLPCPRKPSKGLPFM